MSCVGLPLAYLPLPSFCQIQPSINRIVIILNRILILGNPYIGREGLQGQVQRDTDYWYALVLAPNIRFAARAKMCSIVCSASRFD